GEGRAVHLPFAYMEHGYLAHSYAMTVHKAQGATVDEAFVLIDHATTAEHGYTALSRASTRTMLYVDGGLDRETVEAHAPLAEQCRDRLRASLERSVAQHLAVDQAPVAAIPVDAMRTERDRLRRQLGERPRDRGNELVVLRD